MPAHTGLRRDSEKPGVNRTPSPSLGLQLHSRNRPER
jgi:hypothetical protein